MTRRTNRSCAYCGGGDLTREHLIPKGYFDRTGKATEFIANIKVGEADKFLSTEATIGDVCRECNNEVLSLLDDHFLELFDRYFSRVAATGEELDFEFKFDKLLRWLLKMGYNMGRARRWEGIENLAACRDYIRIGAPSPTHVSTLLQVVTPGFMPGAKRAELLPDIFTINAMRISPFVRQFAFILHVGIHCYQFYVLFHHDGTISPRRTKDFQRAFKGAYELSPARQRMRLYPSSMTLWDLLNGPFLNAGWGQHLRHQFGPR